MNKLIAVFVLVFAAGCSTAPAGRPALEPLWTLHGLASPESVILAPDGALFVSNVSGEGEAQDGDGFIARISRDGRMLERAWATGLDAPKGMALQGGTLFVSDINELLALDAATGAITARHPGGVFLNDVVALRDGAILVADSGGSKIFVLRNGALETWLEHPLLQAVNGLLTEGDRLIVTTMSGRLLAIDIETRAIATLTEGIGDGDGVARLGDSYLVTEWPGRLFHVGPDGAVTTLLDTRAEQTLLNDILLIDDVLLIPNWQPGTLSAYRVR